MRVAYDCGSAPLIVPFRPLWAVQPAICSERFNKSLLISLAISLALLGLAGWGLHNVKLGVMINKTDWAAWNTGDRMRCKGPRLQSQLLLLTGYS